MWHIENWDFCMRWIHLASILQGHTISCIIDDRDISITRFIRYGHVLYGEPNFRIHNIWYFLIGITIHLQGIREYSGYMHYCLCLKGSQSKLFMQPTS